MFSKQEQREITQYVKSKMTDYIIKGDVKYFYDAQKMVNKIPPGNILTCKVANGMIYELKPQPHTPVEKAKVHSYPSYNPNDPLAKAINNTL